MIMKKYVWLAMILISALWIVHSCKKDNSVDFGGIELAGIKVGNTELVLNGSNANIPVDSVIYLEFRSKLDTLSAKTGITLQTEGNANVGFNPTFVSNDITVKLMLDDLLENQTTFILKLSSSIKGSEGETFSGAQVNFTTVNGILIVQTITLSGNDFKLPNHPINVDYENINLEVTFSEPIDTADYKSFFYLPNSSPLSISLSSDKKIVTITNINNLEYYRKYYFIISSELKSQEGFTFGGFNNYFFTSLDSTFKFPLISDEELLDLVQSQTFKYFYDFAHPDCGMSRERNTSGDIVTTGGSGFGVMALIVGMERNFITRAQGLERLDKMLNFLETCDRFHGAWPHWLYGSNGLTHPFTTNDDGADLVETSYMIEGLMTMRQYLDPNVPEELDLINRINIIIDGVEWDWFTRGQNVLYWHWSPNVGWAMNMKIEGYNETLIVYVMAASSATHTISPEVYHQGYARNGDIVNGNSYYGYTLPLGWAYGGPLFFTHYSHLGLDPRNLSDQYANYWEQGVNMSLINWAYCVDNPKNWIGYRTDSWGLTASDNPWGYDAHSPGNDLGVITPSAAVSALPYTPEQSMAAIRHFYYILGDRLWGLYGFYDAFDVTENWWADSYIAIDEGPIICMIENHRTGLLWNLFMSSPEVQQGLTKLGFSY
jgi:hypothetical protein